jgi:putative membrane protein
VIAAHTGHGTPVGLLPIVAAAAVVALYVAMAWGRHREARGWSLWRTTSFVFGVTMLVIAVVPMSPWTAEDLRGHMAQHLIIGMLAPTFLALSGPVTLILRSVPRRWGRRIGRALHSRPARLLAHPVTALTLTIGGLLALYCTPLYSFTTAHPVAHHLVHAHFLVSGYLFAWVVAGPDPAPRRPSVPARLVVLGVAITVHAVVSQLLYAGVIDMVGVSPDERRGAAELMYYGGDIAELILAFALLVAWRPSVTSRRHSAVSSNR